MRRLHLISEAVTFLVFTLMIIFIYYLQKNDSQRQILANRKYRIEHASDMFNSFIQNKKDALEKFSSIHNKNEASVLLRDFSGVFLLNSRLVIKSVIINEKESSLKPGYDYGTTAAGAFFRSLETGEPVNSGMMKSPDNGMVYIYFAVKKDDDILAGRVPLSEFILNLLITTTYPDDVILLALPDGEVLASSLPGMSGRVIPIESGNTVELDNEYFITKKYNRQTGGMIIILTPVSKLHYAIFNTKRHIIYAVIILLMFITLRILLFSMILIRPFERFIDIINSWRIKNTVDNPEIFPFRIADFDRLERTYIMKTREVYDTISELSDNKSELESMRQYLKNIIDSMPSILISVDMNARVTEWNKAAEEFSGIQAENAVGRPIWHMIPELGKYSDAFYEVLSRNELREFKKQPFTNREKLYMDVTIFPVTGLESVAAAIRIDDITMFEKAEKNLRQAQKMEIISVLSTGLAHDFNNVLGGILGAASLIRKKMNGSTDLNALRQDFARYIDIIETSSNRAKDIITRLLSLSMRQEVEFRLTDLNEIARNVESICSNSLDKSVQIITSIPRTAVLVNADSNQIEHVMLNLCINAAHSMTIMRPVDQPRGGRLTIQISDRIPGPQLSAVYVEANQGIDYNSFTVADEGVGIESSRLEKIFEPFYTTKSQISVSGLGLSMAYNIIKLHGGFIHVESAIDSGSRFTVYLPAAEEVDINHNGDHLHQASHGECTLLVIDDEPLIRELASDILAECGYGVITAPDGTAALDIFRERSPEIRLVILDLMMPGMSGLDVFTELRKIDPQVKVLMSSGFVHDERIGKAALMGASGFIHKPYTMEKLSETVYRILGNNMQGK